MNLEDETERFSIGKCESSSIEMPASWAEASTDTNLPSHDGSDRPTVPRAIVSTSRNDGTEQPLTILSKAAAGPDRIRTFRI